MLSRRVSRSSGIQRAERGKKDAFREHLSGQDVLSPNEH